jgi:hypothetical protein
MSAARALLAGTRLGRQRRGALGVAGYHRSARVNAVLEDLVTSGDERVAPAPPAEEPTRPAVTPGDADRQRFTLHWSVDMWRDFNPRAWLAAVEDEASPLPARLSSFADTMTKALSSTGALGSPEAARYWAYHVARSGFFATQAVLGLAAARASAGRSQNPDSAVSRTEALARNGWQVRQAPAARWRHPARLPLRSTLLLLALSLHLRVAASAARSGARGGGDADVLPGLREHQGGPLHPALGHDHPHPPPVQPALRGAPRRRLRGGGRRHAAPPRARRARRHLAALLPAARLLPGRVPLPDRRVAVAGVGQGVRNQHRDSIRGAAGRDAAVHLGAGGGLHGR